MTGVSKYQCLDIIKAQIKTIPTKKTDEALDGLETILVYGVELARQYAHFKETLLAKLAYEIEEFTKEGDTKSVDKLQSILAKFEPNF